MDFYASSHDDFVAHLFGELDAGMPDVATLLKAANCAHHLAPCLVGLGAHHGLVQDLYDIAAARMSDTKLLMSAAYLRENASLGSKGLTLKSIIKVFSMIEAVLAADINGLEKGQVGARHALITTVNFVQIPKGIVTPSVYYCEMDPTKKWKGSAHLVPVPVILERMGFTTDAAVVSKAAYPNDDVKRAQCWALMRGLTKGGYKGRDGESIGSYKVTLPAARLLYDGLAVIAKARGFDIEPFALVFCPNADCGPRGGQATRSLPIVDGNIVRAPVSTAAAA